MAELLSPFEQAALLCGMKWLPPFIVPGIVCRTAPETIARHAADYAQLLADLRNGKLPSA